MYNVTAIITNYKTLHLTKAAVESVRRFYPQLPLIVIDNGSNDESTEYIRNIDGILSSTVCFGAVLNFTNVGHGPALHQGMQMVSTEWALLFDSDCEMLRPGLIEMMLGLSEGTYALGWLRYVDRFNGVPLEWYLQSQAQNMEQFVKYIHPCCALYHVPTYFTLRPFMHHGAPCLQNMIDANTKGLKLVEAPVFEYVKHWKGGTRRMFDSEKGDWNPEPWQKPRPWNPDANVPI